MNNKEVENPYPNTCGREEFNEKKERILRKRSMILDSINKIKYLQETNPDEYIRQYENLDSALNFLKELVNTKKMVDVGFGVEKVLDLSIEEMDIVLLWLELEGYKVYRSKVPNKKIEGKFFVLRILTTSEIKHKDIFDRTKVYNFYSIVFLNRLNNVKNQLQLVKEEDFGQNLNITEKGTIVVKQTVTNDIPASDLEEIKIDIKNPKKIRIKKGTIMLEAFGIKRGDEFDVVRALKNSDGEIYKYIVYYPKLKTTIGLPKFLVEPF